MAKERPSARPGATSRRDLRRSRDTVLFGEVWRRKGLSQRDRSLITVACLIALYRTNELPVPPWESDRERRQPRRDRRDDHPPRLLFGLADRQHGARNRSRGPSTGNREITQRKKNRHAWYSLTRTPRCSLRGSARAENRQTDRRHHPPVGDLHLRLRSLAVSRPQSDYLRRWRWAMSIAASSRRSGARSRRFAPVSSSSGPSVSRTTLARIAASAFSRPACSASS